MSNVSPAPQLGVAEAMGEEGCYQGRYGVQGGRWLLGAFWVLGGARVGRGGYKPQGRARKDTLGLEEVREGVQVRCWDEEREEHPMIEGSSTLSLILTLDTSDQS